MNNHNPKKGVRAPGNWHPGTGKFGELYCTEELRLFMAKLMQSESPGDAPGLPKREKSSSLYSLSEENTPQGWASSSEKENQALAEGQPSPSPSPKLPPKEITPYKQWSASWCQEAAINAPAVRHDRLASLTGQMYYQVSYAMAEALAARQYDERTVATKASREEHLREFADLWHGLDKAWLAGLTAAERAHYGRLTTTTERDAFRILCSFHGLASIRGGPDFPVGVDNLAARLGVTAQYVSPLRRRFETAGIITCTASAVPHHSAARYCWTAAFAPATAPTPLATDYPPVPSSPPAPSAPTPSPGLSMAAQPAAPSPMAQPPPGPGVSPAPTETAKLPTTGNIERRLLAALYKGHIVNLLEERKFRLAQGVDPDELEVFITRAQRAGARLVAANLAYQIDALTFSLTPPQGAQPLSGHASMIYFRAVRDGRCHPANLHTELRSTRGFPSLQTLEAEAQRLVAAGLLTPDFRLIEDPEQPPNS